MTTPNALPPAVGIDLGTTYSLIAYIDPNGRPVSILNENGDLLTPSAVLFEDGEVVVGREAAKGSVVTPQGYAECFKRDMGQALTSRMVHGLLVPPEILSAFVLERLRLDASLRLGPIRQVVITVPAYFDETRRRATQEAGRLAGLDVLDIINEPTAAALAYGYDQGLLDVRTGATTTGRQRVLVYDLGGGTFDVTILEIEGFRFRALATDGDVRLGGKDFDERLVNWLAERFIAEYGADPRSDPADAAQLWLDAQEAKHALSQRTRTTLTCHHAGLRLRVELTRPQFEDLTRDLVERSEITTSLIVKEAGLEWGEIDHVLVVGGSSRIPMVVDMLRRVTRKEPDRSQSPDEAVAHGAAIYAAMIGARGGPMPMHCQLINVNSHSLGVVGIHPGTRSRLNTVVIPKNTPLPCSATRIFQTARADQPSVRVPVVEGESPRPEDCIALGECVIRGLPAGLPKGERIEVKFSYATNGRIAVVGRVPRARVSAHVEIRPEEFRDLEDLNMWRTRLIAHDATPGRTVPALESTKLADPKSVLKRLDAIYIRIGRAAVQATLPPELARAGRNAVTAEQAIAPAEQALRRCEVARAGGTPVDRLRLDAALAEAEAERQRAQVRSEFAYLALGRECVRLDSVPSGLQGEAAESRQLRSLLG